MIIAATAAGEDGDAYGAANRHAIGINVVGANVRRCRNKIKEDARWCIPFRSEGVGVNQDDVAVIAFDAVSAAHKHIAAIKGELSGCVGGSDAHDVLPAGIEQEDTDFGNPWLVCVLLPVPVNVVPDAVTQFNGRRAAQGFHVAQAVGVAESGQVVSQSRAAVGVVDAVIAEGGAVSEV